MTATVSQRIKVLGFIFTCIIVMYHCKFPLTPVGLFDERCNTDLVRIFEQLAALAMSYFFTVTGYLLFYHFSYLKIKKRVFTLLIPYLAWQFIVILLRSFRGTAYTLRDLVHSIFLFETFPPNGPLWYMYAVFVLAFFSPILFIIFRSKRIGWGVLILFIILIQRLRMTQTGILGELCNYGYIENTMAYLPSYLIGAYFGIHADDFSSKEILFCALTLFFITLIADVHYGGVFYNATVQMMPIFMLQAFPIKNFMVDRKIYGLTFIMYAIHTEVDGNLKQSLMNRLWVVFHYACIANLGTRIICLLITLMIAMVIYVVLKKRLPRLLLLLTGGRA